MTAGTTQSEYLNLTLNELFHKIDSLAKERDGAKTRISELEAKLNETEQILNQQTLAAAAANEKEKEKEIAVKSPTKSETQTKSQSKTKTAMKTQTKTKTKAAMKAPAVSNSSKRKKSVTAAAAAASNSNAAGSRSSRRSRLKISSKITGSGFHCANCDTVLPFEGTKKTVVKNVGEDAYNRFPAQKCPKCDGISQYVTSTGGVLLVPGKESW
eukprot:CAMPEP_0116064512 /NCGR_PEP_ID=MMETSP0322-20121206/9155_1 /TAXON_ID=163516 /ORGANISM="Leptocylindrus danicus var. apora, Strain B651" /LENGTH=212 /DNA_ID=CAMNT_0003550537 /DNA_START=38 /DNA_END=676 /DNA_ORIENTATION=+